MSEEKMKSAERMTRQETVKRESRVINGGEDGITRREI